MNLVEEKSIKGELLLCTSYFLLFLPPTINIHLRELIFIFHKPNKKFTNTLLFASFRNKHDRGM